MTSVYKNVNVISIKSNIQNAKKELKAHKSNLELIKIRLANKSVLNMQINKELERTLDLIINNNNINGSILTIDKKLDNMSTAIGYVESIQKCENQITELKKRLKKRVEEEYTVTLRNKTVTKTRYKWVKDESVQKEIDQLEIEIKNYEKMIDMYLK